MLLDSNIIIYAAEPTGTFLSRWVEDAAACISTVSRIEVLGFPAWPRLEESHRARLETLIASLPELTLDSSIAARAIELRRQRRIRLADAIIAAPALIYDLPLITRNTKDFANVAELQIVNPFDGTRSEAP